MMQFQLAYGTHRTLSLSESEQLSPNQLLWWYEQFVAQIKKEAERNKGERGERDRGFRSMIESMGSKFGFLGGGQPPGSE